MVRLMLSSVHSRHIVQVNVEYSEDSSFNFSVLKLNRPVNCYLSMPTKRSAGARYCDIFYSFMLVLFEHAGFRALSTTSVERFLIKI